jgi:hypothetical protein
MLLTSARCRASYLLQVCAPDGIMPIQMGSDTESVTRTLNLVRLMSYIFLFGCTRGMRAARRQTEPEGLHLQCAGRHRPRIAAAPAV